MKGSEAWTDEKLLEVLGYVSINGEDKAIEHYGLKQDTLRRYLDEAKKRFGQANVSSGIALQKIAEQYSDKELLAIANGGRIIAGIDKVPIVHFEGRRIRIGVISDTHLGSSFTSPDMLFQAFEQFKKEKVDFVTHSGDVTEGMSNRAGHIYELSHLGYDKQKTHAIEVLGQWTDTPVYMIDGNHDRWFIKSNGAYIVKDICDVLENYHFIGHDEGDISLNGRDTLKLWHGEDGNSYAVSYRLQKVIESLTGGEKPGAMFVGHTHKSTYLFERHIHCYSAGAIQRQTKWMRGKRIASHTGFWIVDLYVNDSGICKTTGTWCPFYC